MNYSSLDDTICALATGGSVSAIALIRISGNQSIKLINSIFSKNLSNIKSHTLHFGNILKDKEIIDEVVVSVFKKNQSFTGEETVEISCHGSIYIQNKILELLIDKGCRMAQPGEFTMRAFKNGKIDLSQAESVADLISSKSKNEHKVALNQLKGGFSNRLNELRIKLIDFASLIELELDFSEEDVEFANRNDFYKLLNEIKCQINLLLESFSLGNAIKNGISVAIIGPPNSGKSTLLNSLLNEEKAIVTSIAGTTRDVIEDELIIEGFKFRFIDTAGIRKTQNTIEEIGIQKSLQKAKKSDIVLFLLDASNENKQHLNELKKIKEISRLNPLVIINKIDLVSNYSKNIKDAIKISAKNNIGINKIKKHLIKFTKDKSLTQNEIIVTNIRHYEELKKTLIEVSNVIKGLDNNISSDLLSINIRQSLYHLGCITGNVTTDDLLGNIFSKFCIGK